MVSEHLQMKTMQINKKLKKAEDGYLFLRCFRFNIIFYFLKLFIILQGGNFKNDENNKTANQHYSRSNVGRWHVLNPAVQRFGNGRRHNNSLLYG